MCSLKHRLYLFFINYLNLLKPTKNGLSKNGLNVTYSTTWTFIMGFVFLQWGPGWICWIDCNQGLLKCKRRTSEKCKCENVSETWLCGANGLENMFSRKNGPVVRLVAWDLGNLECQRLHMWPWPSHLGCALVPYIEQRVTALLYLAVLWWQSLNYLMYWSNTTRIEAI